MKPLSRIALAMGIVMVVLGIVFAKTQASSGLESMGIFLIVFGAVLVAIGGVVSAFLWLK